MATQPDLRETFEQLDELRRHERRVAMATLVSTKGTTPRREGAKMWVGEGGRILGSVTIGGCVDARVLEESDKVLSDSAPRLLTMSLGDADAWEIGLTCGGTVEVLIEPVELDGVPHPIAAAYDVVRAEAVAGRRSVLVAPLHGDGSNGTSECARLVVRENGESSGTLGDPALDRAAVERALDVILRATSRTEVVAPHPCHLPGRAGAALLRAPRASHHPSDLRRRPGCHSTRAPRESAGMAHGRGGRA